MMSELYLTDLQVPQNEMFKLRLFIQALFIGEDTSKEWFVGSSDNYSRMTSLHN